MKSWTKILIETLAPLLLGIDTFKFSQISDKLNETEGVFIIFNSSKIKVKVVPPFIKKMS
jgi:hypothetical protein